MAELSVAFSPPSLKLRRALLAIHPHGKPWGFLAKESKMPKFMVISYKIPKSQARVIYLVEMII
jgi:hypothetical protein